VEDSEVDVFDPLLVVAVACVERDPVVVRVEDGDRVPGERVQERVDLAVYEYAGSHTQAEVSKGYDLPRSRGGVVDGVPELPNNMTMLARYLAMEQVMLAFDREGNTWMADKIRDVMDCHWHRHMSLEDRKFVNNRPSPPT
jgi:hypothetical protein